MLYLFIFLSGNNRERRRRRKKERKPEWKVRRPGGEGPGKGRGGWRPRRRPCPPRPMGPLVPKGLGTTRPMSFPLSGARPRPPRRDWATGLSAAPSTAPPASPASGLPQRWDRASFLGRIFWSSCPSPSCWEVGFQRLALALNILRRLLAARPCGRHQAAEPQVTRL